MAPEERFVWEQLERAGSHHSIEQCLVEDSPFLREAGRFALLDTAGPYYLLVPMIRYLPFVRFSFQS